MSTLILHVGAGKTGTTALQHALAANAARLAEAGISYPRLAHPDSGTGYVDHNGLAYTLCDDRRLVDLGGAERTLSAHARRFATCIISAEVFYMRPLASDYSDFDDYWNAKIEAVRRVRDFFHMFEDIRVVCYVRRQDLWLESVYNEKLKHFKHGGASFEAFLAAEKEQHFQAQIDLWAGLVGAEHVVVRPYEKRELLAGDIVEDFAALAGLGPLPQPPANEATRNPRLVRDVLEFQRLLYRVPLPPGVRGVVQRALWKISGELMAEHDEPSSWQALLNEDQRREILRRYADSNEHVARTYLGRDDGILFREDVAPSGPAYPGLSLGRAMDIRDRLRRQLEAPAVRRELMVVTARRWVHENLAAVRPLLSPIGRAYERGRQRRWIGYE